MSQQIKTMAPSFWHDYELIDSGEGEKLERFGKFILIRPEPQAIWRKATAAEEWSRLCHAHFTREQNDYYHYDDDINGGWKKKQSMPDSWNVMYKYNGLTLALRLALTNFGHVGVFPEQAENWNFIFNTLSTWKISSRVLNLFAYTGAASMVARQAGADVTHVDASRPGLNWANQNQQINRLENIRWVYEDALKFVRREVKRGNKYNGVIMDPPPYGRGPDGEKWTLHEKLDELVYLSSQLLEPTNRFFILSMYAVGLSPTVGMNVVISHFRPDEMEFGEFLLKPTQGNSLPMGTFVRFRD